MLHWYSGSGWRANASLNSATASVNLAALPVRRPSFAAATPRSATSRALTGSSARTLPTADARTASAARKRDAALKGTLAAPKGARA